MPTSTLFENTFEHAPSGMALISVDGRFLRANHVLCEMLGYSAEELHALTFQKVTHPDDLAMCLVRLGELIRGEVESYQMEKRFFRKDGEVLWIYLGVTLAREIDGRPRFYVAQVTNITPLKRAEQHALAIARQKEQLYYELERATIDLRILQTQLLTVCAWTKQIRTGDKWQPIEDFLTERLHLQITHGISDDAQRDFIKTLNEGNPPPKPPT